MACTYATLLLHDDGIPITAEKTNSLVKAANVTVESYWPSPFVKLADMRNIEDLILNTGSGGTPAVSVYASTAGAGVGAADSTPAAEDKKEEPKEESDDDHGFQLV